MTLKNNDLFQLYFITLLSLSRIRLSAGKHGCLLAGAGAAASSSLLRPGTGGQGGYDRVQRSAQGKQLCGETTFDERLSALPIRIFYSYLITQQLKHFIILLDKWGFSFWARLRTLPFLLQKWDLGRFCNAPNS
jgi:hypothetical protein